MEQITLEKMQELFTAQNISISNQISKQIDVAVDKVNKNIDVKVGFLTEKVEELEKIVIEQANTIKEQEQQITFLRENQVRTDKDHQIELKKKNLILHNIPENEETQEQLQQKITDTIKRECNVDLAEWHFDHFFRLGKKDENKIRPIMLSLNSLKIKEILLRSKKTLKNIGISEDMPKSVLESRKALRKTMEDLKEAGNRVFFKQDKLFVNGKEWSNSGTTAEEQTTKRRREDGPKISPDPKKSQPSTQIIGSNANHRTTPKGPKSIQKKLTESFGKPRIDLNQSMRSNNNYPHQ